MLPSDQLVGERSECRSRYRADLRDLVPRRRLAQVAGRQHGDLLGVTEDDIRSFALDGLPRRLKIIGVPIESLYTT